MMNSFKEDLVLVEAGYTYKEIVSLKKRYGLNNIIKLIEAKYPKEIIINQLIHDEANDQLAERKAIPGTSIITGIIY